MRSLRASSFAIASSLFVLFGFCVAGTYGGDDAQEVDQSPKRQRLAAQGAMLAAPLAAPLFSAFAGVPWGHPAVEGDSAGDGAAAEQAAEVVVEGVGLAQIGAVVLGTLVAAVVTVSASSSGRRHEQHASNHLSISISADGGTSAVLTSTFAPGESAALIGSGGGPSEEIMASRLAAELNLVWARVLDLFTRGPRTNKSAGEKWVLCVQLLMSTYIRDLRAFEMNTGRTPRLLFLTAVHQDMKLAVAFEECCGGLARSVVNSEVLIFGAFSKSMDECPSKKATKANISRVENALHQQKLAELVEKLEQRGSAAMAIYDGATLGSAVGSGSADAAQHARRLHATNGFLLPSAHESASSCSSSSTTPGTARVLQLFEAKLSTSVTSGSQVRCDSGQRPPKR